MQLATEVVREGIIRQRSEVPAKSIPEGSQGSKKAVTAMSEKVEGNNFRGRRMGAFLGQC